MIFASNVKEFVLQNSLQESFGLNVFSYICFLEECVYPPPTVSAPEARTTTGFLLLCITLKSGVQ